MCLVAWLGVGLEDAWAQDKPKEPPKLGWSNTTDLSLVVTEGNSAPQTTVGFSNKKSTVCVEGCPLRVGRQCRSLQQSDDRFFMVGPDIEFPVGGAPANPPTSVIQPEPTLDVSNYLIREATNGRLLRDFSGMRASAGIGTTMPAS